MKRLIQRLYTWLDARLLPIAARNRLLANCYYALFNPHFRREQWATVAGRHHYYLHEATSQIASVILRRNLHRLEKGMSMTIRKPLFALDYIDETLNALHNYLQQMVVIDQALLNYCHDVLQQYFTITTWPTEAKQPKTFAELQTVIQSRLQQSTAFMPKAQTATIACTSGLCAPQPYATRVRANISYTDFLTLCQQRCSTRTFLPKAVPPELIELAISAAAQAPSACNRQPFRYVAALAEPMLSRLATLPMGTVGYAHNIPAILAVVGDLSAYPFERDRHIIYIDASLANMQLMLALETLGLASCSINWPDIETYELKVSALLKLQPFERVVMLIAVGYPDPEALIPFSQKKSATELVEYV